MWNELLTRKPRTSCWLESREGDFGEQIIIPELIVSTANNTLIVFNKYVHKYGVQCIGCCIY
jgi:hypothetical protein